MYITVDIAFLSSKYKKYIINNLIAIIILLMFSFLCNNNVRIILAIFSSVFFILLFNNAYCLLKLKDKKQWFKKNGIGLFLDNSKLYFTGTSKENISDSCELNNIKDIYLDGESKLIIKLKNKKYGIYQKKELNVFYLKKKDVKKIIKEVKLNI